MGTEGIDGQGTLWGPLRLGMSKTDSATPLFRNRCIRSGQRSLWRHFWPTWMLCSWNQTPITRHAGTLRTALLPLIDQAGPRVDQELAARLDAHFPNKNISLIGGQVTISAATLARWHLLWAMARIGHGRVPITYLSQP